jgi:hypothetical protein
MDWNLDAPVSMGLYLPETLDARLKGRMERSRAKKIGTLILSLVRSSLETDLSPPNRTRGSKVTPERQVFRVVSLSRELNNELRRLAFRRAQTRSELTCDLLRKALG